MGNWALFGMGVSQAEVPDLVKTLRGFFIPAGQRPPDGSERKGAAPAIVARGG